MVKFFASFIYFYFYSYRTSNFHDSNNRRSFSLLKALVTNFCYFSPFRAKNRDNFCYRYSWKSEINESIQKRSLEPMITSATPQCINGSLGWWTMSFLHTFKGNNDTFEDMGILPNKKSHILNICKTLYCFEFVDEFNLNL